MMTWLGSFYLNSFRTEALGNIPLGFLHRALILLYANTLLKDEF